MKTVVFRGGPLDGRRWEVAVVTSFILVPTRKAGQFGFGTFRYRQAQQIGDRLVVYEVDAYRQ